MSHILSFLKILQHLKRLVHMDYEYFNTLKSGIF